MTEPPTMDELARRYLDLWEEQVAAAAADPALAAQIGRLFESIAQFGPVALFGGMAAGETRNDGNRESEDGSTRTPATGAASSSGDGDLDEFTRRIATVEERVAALERSAGGKSRRAAPRARAKGTD